jgi:hypothetical protein
MALPTNFATTGPSINGVSITDALATHDRSRGVFVGTGADYDFSYDGSTWVLYKNLIAGVLYPFEVVGARKNSGSAAPSAGDIVFQY